MDDFKYFPAKDVKEACALLAQYGEEAKILSGGQSLVTLMKQKFVTPSYIVDIKGISDLDYIRYSEDDGLRIGGLTPHRTVEKSDSVKEKFPMLTEMESMLASVAVRNWGTVGGNLCSADPASDLAPTLIALGAEAKIHGPDGARVIPLVDIFTGDGKCPISLGPADLLTEVVLPVPPQYSSSAYLKYRVREAIDFPLLGVAANITLASNDGKCEQACLVLGAVSPKPVKITGIADILKGKTLTDERIEKVSEKAFKQANPLSNLMDCSAQYRKELVRVFTERAINAALHNMT